MCNNILLTGYTKENFGYPCWYLGRIPNQTTIPAHTCWCQQGPPRSINRRACCSSSLVPEAVNSDVDESITPGYGMFLNRRMVHELKIPFIPYFFITIIIKRMNIIPTFNSHNAITSKNLLIISWEVQRNLRWLWIYVYRANREILLHPTVSPYIKALKKRAHTM
jgi:hypothetical protein